MSRRSLFIIASVIVSGLFLWLALRGVPFEEVIDGIRQADVGWVIVGFGFVWVAAAARTFRWQVLLGGRVRWWGVHHSYNMTNFLNLLPLRAGEVGRTLAISTRYGVPLVTAATSVVVERLIDLVMIIVILAVGVSQVENVPPVVGQSSLLFGAVAVTGLIVLIVLARFPAFAGALLRGIEARLPFVRRLGLIKRLEEVLSGLEILTDVRRLFWVIVWSIFSWIGSAGVVYPLVIALGIYGHGLEAVTLSLIVVALVSFSIAIPVSVASIGPWEGAVRLAGDMMGVPPDLSLTLGFLFHGVAAVGYIVFGMISLLALGISLSEMLGGKAEKRPLQESVDAQA
ncbi:MAG: lysylphosphatidylglycerol synthase transmembrane domain-containing protein [bacterium]|nr:lysylphosphatidylglycerol synthase transmembrane domain-containing protein [bacterium]